MDPKELDQIAAILETGSPTLDTPDELRQVLFLRGVLLSLRLDGSAEATGMLAGALEKPQSPEIKALALRFLCELALELDADAIDAIFNYAVKNQDDSAIDFIHAHLNFLEDPQKSLLFNYLYEKGTTVPLDSRDPFTLAHLFQAQPAGIQERMLRLAPERDLRNWAIIVQALRDAARLASLIETFPRFNPSDQKVCLDLLAEKARNDPQVRDCICQLFIHHEYLPARDLALDNHYRPEDPIQAALFAFLAEDWAGYEQIDFSQKLLSAAYELANQPVRHRILALSQKSGQVEWLQTLSSHSRTRWLKELRDDEWDSTIQMLTANSRFSEMWLLAQAAPPIWSARILRSLQTAQWAPEDPEDASGFSILAGLAQTLHQIPLTFTPISSWVSETQETACMATDDGGINLAAGTTQTAILRWDVRAYSTPLPTLFSQPPGTSTLAFSPNANYLAISSSDHKIRIFDLSKDMIVKTLEGHKGLVRALAFHPNGRFLYTASFDGTIQAWRFPIGIKAEFAQASRHELFGIAVSFDGKSLVCAGAEKVIQVYSLPQMELSRSLTGHVDTVTLLAASRVGPYAASYGRDQRLLFWNFASGKQIGSAPVANPLASLTFHLSGDTIFGGTMSGDVLVWDFPTGKPLLTLRGHEKPVLGLGMAVDGSRIISGSADGRFCIWNLETFISIRTPVETLLSHFPIPAKSSKGIELSKNEQVWTAFINALVAWRKRFDIELTEMHGIVHAGEFDIEL